MKRPLRWWMAIRRALSPPTIDHAFMSGYALGCQHTEEKMTRQAQWAREDRILMERMMAELREREDLAVRTVLDSLPAESATKH